MNECLYCGETENLHFNFDFSMEIPRVESILCNECGAINSVSYTEVKKKP